MDNTWYFYKNGLAVGPLDLNTLLQCYAEQKITLATPVRNGESANWQTYQDYQELQAQAPLQSGSAAGSIAAIILSERGDMVRFSCPGCAQHMMGKIDLLRNSTVTCVRCEQILTIPISTIAEISNNSAKVVPAASPAASPANAAGQAEFPAGPDSQELLEMAADNLEGDITCPHCWQSFSQENLLYIAAHPALVGDKICGEFEQRRFLPTSFNSLGQPLDAQGMACTEMACPRCHLRVPSTTIDLDSIYFSIVGAPSSGKSYYLTVLLHELRRSMTRFFGYSLLDTDPLLNAVLQSYERTIFMALDRQQIVVLPKTHQTGQEFSDQVQLDGIPIDLPKPFIFELRAWTESIKAEEKNYNLVFYDNAGEQFQPGADLVANPATQHLAHSHGIIFLFDPTNDAYMRDLCDSADPQVQENARVSNQATLLSEMINRIRRHKNMTARENCDIPLVIAVAKYDTWRKQFPYELSAGEFMQEYKESFTYRLDRSAFLNLSFHLRAMLLQQSPDVVNTAEAFFSTVYFVPVSSFGCLAERNDSGAIGIIPAKITPMAVEFPFWILLLEYGIIPFVDRKKQGVKPLLQCKEDGGSLLFRHPVSDEVIRLPGNYAGAVLDIAGTQYILPQLTSQNKNTDGRW